MKKSALLGLTLFITLFLSDGPAQAAAKLTNIENVKTGYDDGFVLNVDDRFSIRFQAYLQFQHLYANNDGAPDTSTFKVDKGRLRWDGFVYNPNIGYVIQLELANPQAGEEKNVALKDFLVDIKHYDHAQIRLGQFKVPFNRQQLAFFGDLQFVDISDAAKRFNANQVNARDIGVQFSGDHENHLIEYFAGLFNGNGLNRENDSTQYLTVFRIVLNPLGPMSISESDLANSQSPLLSVGAGLAIDGGNADPAPTTARETVETLALEFAFKQNGASVQGEYYVRNADRNADASGGYLQAGFFVVPQKVEVAGRFSHFNPDGGNNDVTEITGGLNFFFAGHRRKLQFDVSALSSDPGNRDDLIVRSQYQVSF